LPGGSGAVRLWRHADANLPLARLGSFRTELHACFTRRADALFELGDALLCAPAVPSLPHLSLEPVCRRGWGSVYAALARGRIDTERLQDLLASHLPDADPPVFAVDVTTWPRCDAECSPGQCCSWPVRGGLKLRHWFRCQIAKASSSNATASRNVAGSSIASS
jgi:DDE superfamily endonuclease